MTCKQHFLKDISRIYEAARGSCDGELCAVAPAPELRARINQALRATVEAAVVPAALRLKVSEPSRIGFNDGTIVPPEEFPLGTPPAAIRAAAADRAPLRGTLRVIVVLVDFSDRQMAQTQNHFRDLFFSLGTLSTKSVREYYHEVTNGLIDIQGDVVGPFRLPQTLAAYAHGASGIGSALPNAQTMARDALLAADPSVNFTPYDNDGNGYVDAFIVIHAGSGGEVTGNSGDIWSHKWVLDGGARAADSTKVYGYLTVPEDCRIGVCAHELGHLLFGFPDLYDTDNSSEGIGNWCLMAAGSWGGNGDTPTHPSAWCKANQGWVSVNTPTANLTASIPDVKSSHAVYRLWKDGGAGNEYFLVENRQQAGFDVSLPGPGLLIWHIDESKSSNTDENHYKVALMQADGRRDLELNHNRGDAGDPFPGSSNNRSFTSSSTPNSKSYGNSDTCVGVTAISNSAASMTAHLQVNCAVKHKDIKDIKESLKEAKDRLKDTKEGHKDVKDFHKDVLIDKHIKEFDKPIGDHPGKPVIDKLDKPGDGRPGGFGQTPANLEARVAALEAAMGGQQAPAVPSEPFIGSELRPDLSQGAYSGEEDVAQLRQQMQLGSAQAKRGYDSKTGGR